MAEWKRAGRTSLISEIRDSKMDRGISRKKLFIGLVIVVYIAVLAYILHLIH